MKKIISQKKICMKLAHILEVILALVVIVTVALGVVDTLRIIWNAYIVDFSHPVEYVQLNDILGQILMLVRGVELVAMLSLHKPAAVIEVLLYAIARKLLLIPKTSSMLDLVLGVVAIAGIFTIKKYLIKEQEIWEEKPEEVKELSINKNFEIEL